MPTTTYTIDGRTFSTLDEFFEVFGNTVLAGYRCRGLDSFNDVLRGGFGSPDDGFIMRWTHSDVSRRRLGYEETARCLRERLLECHPNNRIAVELDLREALRHHGPTVFDWLVEIIRDHGADRSEAEDNVVLVLEP